MVAQIAGRFASSALARPTPVRFSQRLLARCEDPQNRKGLVLTHSTRGLVQDLFARNLGTDAPLPHHPEARPETGSAGPTALGQWPPPGHTHGPHLPFPVGFPCAPPHGSRPQRRQGRGTPCEASATHEPQTPPSLSLRFRTPLVVIHKCILPPFLNLEFSFCLTSSNPTTITTSAQIIKDSFNTTNKHVVAVSQYSILN